MEIGACCVDSKGFDLRVIEIDGDEANTVRSSFQQCLLRCTDKTSTNVRSEHLLPKCTLCNYRHQLHTTNQFVAIQRPQTQ